MSENRNLNDSNDTVETERVTFNQWGKEFAQATKCNPNSIQNGLNEVYSDFLTKQQLDENAIKNKIDKLNEDIEKLKQNSEERRANNEHLSIENQRLNDLIDEKKNEILELENEILEITGGRRKQDKSKLNLYATFSIISLIGTLLAYMATFGSAILGLEEGDQFIRGAVFSDLVEEGIGILVFAIFISIIPIACGYFYGKFKRDKKIIASIATLGIVLIVDLIIGYKLAETIYNRGYEDGLYSQPWQFDFFVTDAHFWIVLLINFAMYMTFSLLSNAYFEEEDRLSPNSQVEQTKNKISLLKEKMEEFRSSIVENDKQVKSNLSEIERNKISIDKKEIDIEDYKNGRLPLNIVYLKQLIAEFLKGYQSYVNLMIENTNRAEEIVKKVLENAENWFVKKESDGWRKSVEIKTDKNFFGINLDNHEVN